MPTDPLELPATPPRVARLVDAFAIDAAERRIAYDAASTTPSRATWITVLDRVLLACGAMLSVAGVIFFFAFNWAKLPIAGKFGILGVSILIAVAASQRLNLDRPAGKITLLVGTILVGPLFAVFGQHYQTGADPYELFLAWAFLTIPWAIAGRSAALWGVVLAIADTGFSLFAQQGLDGIGVFARDDGNLLLFGTAPLVVAIVAIELTDARAQRSFRVLAWILAFFAMAAFSLGAAVWIIERNPSPVYSVCLGATLASWCAMAAVYVPRREIPMLVIAGTSFIGMVTTLVGHLVESATRAAIPTLFVTSAVLIFLVAQLVSLLKKVRASSAGDAR